MGRFWPACADGLVAIRGVPCVLDGREYLLRLDLGAMAALADHGIVIDDLVAALAADWSKGQLSPKNVLDVLWAMLQGEDEPPTRKQIGRWVDGDNFGSVAEHVGEALKLAFPEKPKDAPPSPRRGAGTGRPPSASRPAPSP